MKEAVDDIMVTLNEAASEVGMVGGMVESIAEAMAKVSAAGQTLVYIRFPFSWIPLVISFHAHWFFQRTLVQLQGIIIHQQLFCTPTLCSLCTVFARITQYGYKRDYANIHFYIKVIKKPLQSVNFFKENQRKEIWKKALFLLRKSRG